jgi:twitching motility protein PilT
MAAIDALFRLMVQAGASDLHLTSGQMPRLRVDGALREQGSTRIDRDQMVRLLKEIAPESCWAEYEKHHDTDFAYALEGVARFRANYFRDVSGPGAVFRVIPEKIRTAEELKLPKAVLDLCTLHKGLVLVTGPTGSGKSTTLAAMVDHVNRQRDDHIITIEDPVEFVHKNQRCLVNHREVGSHTNSFHSALRAALREDPDVILLGELRDLETTAIALEMAETGHLVFGTLHTTTAASTVDRIVDQFPTDQQAQIRTVLSGTLKGVVAQNLLKKKGGGRVAALEILLINNAVANYIREGKTHQIPMAMQTAKGSGMQELNAALVQLVKDGLVEPSEALLKAVDRDGLLRDLARHGLMPAAATAEVPAIEDPAPSLTKTLPPGSQVSPPPSSGAPTGGLDTARFTKPLPVPPKKNWFGG